MYCRYGRVTQQMYFLQHHCNLNDWNGATRYPVHIDTPIEARIKLRSSFYFTLYVRSWDFTILWSVYYQNTITFCLFRLTSYFNSLHKPFSNFYSDNQICRSRYHIFATFYRKLADMMPSLLRSVSVQPQPSLRFAAAVICTRWS